MWFQENFHECVAFGNKRLRLRGEGTFELRLKSRTWFLFDLGGGIEYCAVITAAYQLSFTV